jgi:hypothetical protein
MNDSKPPISKAYAAEVLEKHNELRRGGSEVAFKSLKGAL